MATQITTLIPYVRSHLVEPTANFWTDAELVELMIRGIRDLWRDIVDLKGEHYLTVDTSNVTLEANDTQLTGVPSDVHKVFMIEPADLSINGPNRGLVFKPQEYNSNLFMSARGEDPIDPTNSTIYYAITKQGAPYVAPTILTAPRVTSQVEIAFSYVPSIGFLTSTDYIPVPGEADNACIAWTVAFARAKEREDRSPDDAWLSVYATEKSHLLQSLGLRQYQEPSFAEAVYGEYW